MKITVDGNQLELTVFAVEAVEPTDWQVKKEYGTEDLKLSADGKQMYTTRKSLVFIGERGAENGVSLAVTNPEPLAEMTKYKLAGKVTVTPWINNNRIATSLVAERLEPIVGKSA